MRAYRVEVSGRVRFAGTSADSTATRAELCAATGAKKTSSQIEVVEIPAAKADFLDWLNELVKELQPEAS